MKKKNNPSSPSPEYETLMSELALPHTLMKGTKGMREAGETYLPKEEAEDQISYDSRVKRTFLFRGYERTVDLLTGEVFDKPVTLDENTPESINELSKNIDMQGNNLSRFTRKVFNHGLIDGSGFIMVDSPPLPKDDDGNERQTTKADDEDLERRPYWVHIPAANLIGWSISNTNGILKLENVRISENIKEKDGEFGEKTVEQIRIIYPGRWEIWRKANDKQNKDEWIIEDKGSTSFPDKIPIAGFFCGRKVSFMTCSPPLTGLAELNQQHWISSSDQNNILHVCRVPILFGKCLQVDEKTHKVIISPNNLIHSQQQEGDLKFVEHTGKAMEDGWKDMQQIENKMELWGLALVMQQRTGNVTATERAMTGAKTGSFLNDCALGIQDTINTALVFTSEMMKGPNLEAVASVNTDFSLMLSATSSEGLLKAYQINLLDRKTVIDELKRRGEISDETDIAEVLAGIESDNRISGSIGKAAGMFLGA